MTPKTLLLPSGILQRGAFKLPGRAPLPPPRPPPKRATSTGGEGARREDGRDEGQDDDEEKTSPFVEALAAVLDPCASGVPPFRPGDVIANKYRVEEVLGCGGMAWVLRATHLQLRQTVALKFLRFAATREAVARFFQEGRAAARVSSEAVTRILDVDTLPDGSPFLVMEFLDGRDLEKVVADPGWMAVPMAVDLAIQACEGLAEVHAAGIVHRDLKPANLFLTRKRNGSIRMKLLDFGISKFASGGPFGGHEAPQTSTHALMGSPVYMAPEQMCSTKHVDGRADIWSLGVILYELLSGGCSPFRGETLPEVCMRVMRETPSPLVSIRSDVPEGLAAVVSRCLEKSPARRYTSAASLAIALAPYASPDGQRLAARLQRRPSTPPGSDVSNATARVPEVAGRTAAAAPAATIQLPRTPLADFDRTSPGPALEKSPSWMPPLALEARYVWASAAVAALVVVASVASFAAGVRVSSGARPAVGESATASSMGVTNRMPQPAPPPIATEVLAPERAPSEPVYRAEDLPVAPPPSATTRRPQHPAHP
jgi:serine/threonine protein kinase